MERRSKAREYQFAVITAGLAIWLMSGINTFINYSPTDQWQILLFVPVVIAIGLAPQHIRLPLGRGVSWEQMNFTLTDAIVLLVACWYGFSPAVFLAGLESFASSRSTTSRLSSNMFSLGMMSLGTAAASLTLTSVLRFGFDISVPTRGGYFLAVSLAMFAASLIQIASNLILLATLMALRHGEPVRRHWKEFLPVAVLFLPTSSVATLMYLALQYNLWLMLIIGGPVFLTLNLWLRVYRNNVQKRIAAVEKAHRETIEALAVAINAKDEVTHDHVLRVQIYAAGVARLLDCSEEEIEALKSGALLHDIGKIAVPDYILEKPGKLTAAEFEKMKIHTIAGAQILSRVEFPYPIVPIVRHHHERWDGQGYPDSLKGEAIPITARILAVVDCFDAVREDRQYRKGLSREEAIALILKGSGSQYDPKVVSMFIAHLPEFEAEIEARRHLPPPTFGVEPIERLSEAARRVPPAAGLADEEPTDDQSAHNTAQDRVKAICHLAQGVIGAQDRERMLAAFAARLRSLVDYDTCAITLVTPETGLCIVAHAAGEHAELLQGRRIALGEGVTGWVIANKKPFCNTDPKLDLPSRLADYFSSYRTLAVFPIIEGEAIYGAVTLYSSAISRYTIDHNERLEEATTLIAAALSADDEAAILWPESLDDSASQSGSVTTESRRKSRVPKIESKLPS
ncbi:MAG: HD domain-containing phosphohydrolase [Acidobacteriota bacterium]